MVICITTLYIEYFDLKEKMMKNKKFWLGMLVIVLVFGMTVVGCASYLELMDRTTPGWRDQEPIKLFPDGSGGGSSPSTGSSPGGGGSPGGSTPTAPQQPPSTDTTITRTYTFDVPTSGQAGGGASATAKAEAEANATQRFRTENPGYEIRNVQSTHDGFGTLTVTITGRKPN
jgi:hypothetical protein